MAKKVPSINTPKFYEFMQNNSGGRFYFNIEKGIGNTVLIEAASYQDANEKAENIGLYFDGVDDDRDCPCCGDRWYRIRYDEGFERLDGEMAEWWLQRSKMWGCPAFVHFLDGTFKTLEEALKDK